MRRLVLWDVDHTLVENSGISKETYAAAYEMLTGELPLAPARTEGRTDRLIMRGMFDAHRREMPSWPEVEAALSQAGAARFRALQTRGSALPGAADALEAVGRVGGVVQSVLTGNVRANAQVKLAAFGLVGWLDLDVGAYGADGDDRAELVPVARARAARAYADVGEKAPTVLIGDTPRDVAAAHDSGVGVVAVASGVHDAACLAAAGARLILPDLRDTDAVVGSIRLAFS
ncbi:haloacid dehalogenase-like hydrolase [Streptomyces longispororuber]|uniref:haloacid dehalogenase-like hydrolase n=1 Tax=Streptomyces longispororuber TaxID=68230 RepID=UPI0036F4D777